MVVCMSYLDRIRDKRMRSNANRKDFTMTAKVLFTGKTRITGGRDGAARSSDGHLDIRLAQPHPAAEHLFGAAWSTCFLGAIELAASQRKITLSSVPTVDAEIDLNRDGARGVQGYFLRARLNVSLPDLDREIAQTLVEAAHEICPYSKATRGNIDVETTLV
jgi:Ohr subfamily peroxiredoxin